MANKSNSSERTESKNDWKRALILLGLGLGPSLLYFHKHRLDLMSSAFRRKASYYDPNEIGLGYGTLHHAKEICIRLAIGSFTGYALQAYLYGPMEEKQVI